MSFLVFGCALGVFVLGLWSRVSGFRSGSSAARLRVLFWASGHASADSVLGPRPRVGGFCCWASARVPGGSVLDVPRGHRQLSTLVMAACSSERSATTCAGTFRATAPRLGLRSRTSGFFRVVRASLPRRARAVQQLSRLIVPLPGACTSTFFSQAPREMRDEISQSAPPLNTSRVNVAQLAGDKRDGRSPAMTRVIHPTRSTLSQDFEKLFC